MNEGRSYRHGLEPFLDRLPQSIDADARIAVRVRSDLGQINLRCDANDEALLAKINDALGQDVPLVPNTMSNGDCRNYWLGPDEWLIMTALGEVPHLIARLREKASLHHVSVTDVSGGQVVLDVRGPDVRELLAKGSTLDLRPDRFRVGDCAQTGLAKTSVLIGLIDDEPVYEITVRRSFADYLMRWMLHSGRECGIRFAN